MDFILYKYSCPRWYTTYSGVKNIKLQATNEKELVEKLTSIENSYYGSQSCKIDLLQKYELSIRNVKNYAGITTIPVNVVNNPIIENEKIELCDNK